MSSSLQPVEQSLPLSLSLFLIVSHPVFSSISGTQILMIRYPSSQLGEMSLEEHSQCECRCQPGPSSELRAWVPRVGGGVVVHMVVLHSGDQIARTPTGVGLGSGVKE